MAAEHRGGYHALTVAMAEALYDHGVVFDRTDMHRFVRTATEVCWNGSFERPVFVATDGKPRKGHRFLAPALARFEPKIWKFLYEAPGPTERLAQRKHSWRGGPVAAEYLRGKYLTARTPEPTRTRFRARFAAEPANARWLAEMTAAAATRPAAAGGSPPAPRRPDR